jgi:hypothetical protein
MNTSPKTILALAPGNRHLGLAVFSGDNLVYFAVKGFCGKKTRRILFCQATACIERLIRRYRPDILAIEEAYYVQALSCPLLLDLIRHFKKLGRRRRMRVVSLLPTEVKQHFCPLKPTRSTLAEAMAQRYPYLRNFQREHRTRLYWQQMFDAIGLGAFVASQLRARSKRRQGQRADNHCASARD